MVIGVAGGRAYGQVQFPTVSRNYVAWMARAMDQCIPSGLTVIPSGVPATGCIATNVNTDNLMTMQFAKLVVNARTGKLRVYGKGLIPGSRVKVQLTLRVTKNGVSAKHPPGTSQRVTFEDIVLLCAHTPFGFVVSDRGILAGQADLATCLSPDPALATGNIEIFNSGLVNADNGNKLFARAGILR
jgi:hypothetical protein